MQFFPELKSEFSRLHSLGHIVLPLESFTDQNGKITTRPSKEVGKWSQLLISDERPIYKLINATGIAIYCGHKTGIIAIDVDTINPGLTHKIETEIQRIAPTRYGKFGSKGITLFYQCPPFLDQKKRIAPSRLTGSSHNGIPTQGEFDVCVDILFNSLCNMPPSSHPKGGNYVYPDRYEPLVASKDLPEITKQQYDNIIDYITRLINPISSKSKVSKTGETRFIEIQRKAMDLCRTNIDADPKDLALALEQWDREQLFQKGPYFSDPSHQDSISVIHGCRKKIYQESQDTDFAFDFLNKAIKEENTVTLPEHSGLLKKIYDLYSITASSCRDHNMRYCASLLTLAALISKSVFMKYLNEEKFSTNMNLIILAGTGAGKTTLKKQIKKLFETANPYADEVMKPRNARNIFVKNIGLTLQYVIESIEDNSVNLLLEDEAKTFYTNLTKNPQAQSSTISFDSFFTQLFDSSDIIDNTVKSVTGQKEKRKQKIIDAKVSLLAISTEEDFLREVSSQVVKNGFLNRCLILNSEISTDDSDDEEIDEYYSDDQISIMRTNLINEIFFNLESEKIFHVKLNHPIRILFKNQKKEDENNQKNKKDKMAARRAMIIAKIAMVFAFSEDQKCKEITEAHWHKAKEIYSMIQMTSKKVVNSVKISTPLEKVKQDFLIQLIPHKYGLPMSTLDSEHLNNYVTKKQAVSSLIDEGLVFEEIKKNRPKIIIANFEAIYNANRI